MNNVELIHYSLGFAFQLLDGLVSDLTQKQADWMPPGNANSIGSLYWHTVHYVDRIGHDWGVGKASLSQRARWQEKVLLAAPPVDPEDPMGDLRAVREGLQVDLPALHDYAGATSKALLTWVASLTAVDLERTLPTPIGKLNLGQMLEAFIISHSYCHSGEISALRGCQGLKGYPW